MLLLSLCSITLAELFSAQRVQAVLAVDSAHALWVAEAGIQHAAHDGAAITAPVTFAGGSYSVTKSGQLYTATGVYGQATRVVSLEHTDSNGGGGSSGQGPIDESASSSTAIAVRKRRIALDLISISPTAAVMVAFSLSADVATEDIRKLKHRNKDIWRNRRVGLPTGNLALNKGPLARRTLLGGRTSGLTLEFSHRPRGTVQYTLVLFFKDATSSTLNFTIDW